MWYTRFDEQINVQDSFQKAADFLVAKDFKWFLIALHHGIHHLCIIFLHRKDPFLIWKPVKRGLPVVTDDNLPDHFAEENKLNSPIPALEKTVGSLVGDEMVFEGHTLAVLPGYFQRLNNDLRNGFVHFVPQGWAISHQHIKEVCEPLVHLATHLTAKIDDVGLQPEVKQSITNSCNKILGHFSSE